MIRKSNTFSDSDSDSDSGLFCDLPFNGVDHNLRHRNISGYTDIFKEFFCFRRDSELLGGGHLIYL
jgi:hypothetical protein